MRNIYACLIMGAIYMVGFGGGCRSDEDTMRMMDNKQTVLVIDNMVSEYDSDYKKLIVTKFLDPHEFTRTSVIDAKTITGYPIAGIVNHHSLAMDLQARFFKSLKSIRPEIKTFVIISPDHFLAGDLVSTHGFGYMTPAGEVMSVSFNGAGVYDVRDIKTFANEHGIGALAPFIAREFSGAKVVPVYIRPEATQTQLQKLGQAISEQMDEQTFVIVSSDMSHYLVDAEARENDKITLIWLEENNWKKLTSADDDYTDSAQGFKVLQNVLKNLSNEYEFELLDYAISTDYGANPNETTSYINGYYVEKK